MRYGKRKPLSLLLLLPLVTAALQGCKIGEEKTAEEQNQQKPPAFQYSTDPNYYTELYRPQYHLSPESGNMSDPNGMVYFEGEYHQFYQNSGQWGHAVSTDLLHWTHLPVALVRDPLGEIWSGSAVVDKNDTSGFFGGKAGLVAIFTHFQNGTQSQSIAYSSDKGRTWTKYEGNPVIPNPGLKDFRDPKVIWHEPSKSWVMVVSADNKVLFYSSKDLKTWEQTGEFGSGQGSHAAVWECPDLFELPVEGTDQKKWVLTVSIGNNEQTKGSTAQYFIGSFDGKTFTNENEPSNVLWTDYAKDFYAAISYSDIPAGDGRRIWLGWMSNWRYPFSMPTEPWKGNMSVPRALTLKDVPGEGIRLFQQPVKELESLRGSAVSVTGQNVAPGSNLLSSLKGNSYELDTEFTVASQSQFGIKLRTGEGQETVVRYDPKAAELTVDRSKSGEASFEKGFAESFAAPLKPEDGKIKLRIFVDESTLEVFGNDGKAVLTSLIFPAATSNGLELFAAGDGITLNRADFYPMRPVWRNEDPSSSKPLRIVLDKYSLDVPLNGTGAIRTAVEPLISPQQLTWESSDASVAEVRAEGENGAVVTGKKEGSVEIKASTPDGAVSAVLNVFVFKP
ncbi:GH32 C-terminal domain-containing protein [Paenibacillus beijingensis]|uniref:Levanase n=1 Tax=Paenibacillus beijingensis TaxID=1126833 RepID=A0A0D5NFE4_9BACL|nr:GH32 C-terminal domain-containing protein [Paenibacillus beijingensis]AJY73870.1 levanase [Paenibacillus beijingensis]